MKIAILQTSLVEPTGGERQSLMLALELQKQGHEVTIFTQSVNRTKCFPELQNQLKIVACSSAISSLEGKIVVRKWNFKFLYLFRYYKNFLQAKAFYSGIRETIASFDVVNFHNYPMEWVAFFLKRDFPEKKAVWMCNEPPFWYLTPQSWLSKWLNYPLFRYFDKACIKRIDKLVVLDELNRKRVSDIYGRSAEVIRSGVETKIHPWSPEDISRYKRELGFKENDFIILFVATFAIYKRPDKVVLSLMELVEKKNIKAVLVGTGEMEDELRRMVKGSNLEQRVVFLKHLSENTLSKLYSMADTFVFPANQTWGLSAIEAMAHGKPVLISRDSGVSEVVRDNDNALLINGSDPRDIARGIRFLYENRQEIIRIGESARKFVVENLSWENYALNMLSQFRGNIKE